VGVDLACIQPSTGATITLLVVFFWILVVLARPFRWWKGLLICTMAVLAVLAFVLPIGHQFFGFNAPAALVWPSVAIGVVGAAVIEVLHRWSLRARATPVVAAGPSHDPS
jgi:cation-transporting ATPase E